MRRTCVISIAIISLLASVLTARARQTLPAAQIDRVADLVKFSVEDDLLTARTSLGQPGQEVRIVVPGAEGVIRLNLLDIADDEPGRNFGVNWSGRAPDGLAEVITQISATAGHLLIARGSESDRGVSNIQYIQTAPHLLDATGGEAPVKLYVQITKPASGAGEADLKLSATSFTELRRKHPREVNQYLRPILRDFGQEQAIFGADVRAQWQVLSPDLQPDPATIATVNAVIAKFDSENYPERERAAEELQKLGQPAAVALLRMDRSKFSAEQNSGVDTFLAPYLPLAAADVRRLRDSVDFLLDCVYSDDDALRRLAIARLEKIAGHSLNIESGGTDEARATAVERLRQQLSAATMPTSQP